jgi:hypothetical protein
MEVTTTTDTDVDEARPEFIIARSTFNQDTEDWSKEGDSPPLGYNPTAGNPGGCLEIKDLVHGISNYFIASPLFLGNKRVATGLRFDIMWKHQPPIGNTLVGLDLIKLTRDTTVLKYVPPALPAEGSWVHVNVRLSPGAGWLNATTNQPATQQEFTFVMSKLQKLQIRSEYYRGGETDRLDNVFMYSVRTPPTLPE